VFEYVHKDDAGFESTTEKTVTKDQSCSLHVVFFVCKHGEHQVGIKTDRDQLHYVTYIA